MKKRVVFPFIFAITIILASCGLEGQNNFNNGSDAIKDFQSTIKDIDSHSIKSTNRTEIDFQNKTSEMKQTSYGRTNHHDKLAFNIEQTSNNKDFKTKNKSILIDENDIKSSPKTKYLNYKTKNAEIDHFQKIGQDWFDLTTFNQSLLKPIEDDITLENRTLSYSGTGKVMTYLYQLGFSQSPMVDQESLSQISDLEIKKGDFKLTLQDDKTLPKKLKFNIEATGKIKNETIKIKMSQTTDFYKYNDTNVKGYSYLKENKYK